MRLLPEVRYESLAAQQDLLLAFNRGFTSGYLFGERHGALMGRDAADNRGICIGVVKQYDEQSRTVTVTSTGGIIPRPGDGLHFIPAGRFRLRSQDFPSIRFPGRTREKSSYKSRSRFEPGSMVYITSSTDLTHRAREIVAHPSCHPPAPCPPRSGLPMSNRREDWCLNGLIHTRKGRELPVNIDRIPSWYLHEPIRSPGTSRGSN